MTRRRLILAALLPGASLAIGLAAWRALRRSADRRRGGRAAWPGRDFPTIAPACPNWKVDERFKNDVFTFVRVEYDSGYGGGGYG